MATPLVSYPLELYRGTHRFRLRAEAAGSRGQVWWSATGDPANAEWVSPTPGCVCVIRPGACLYRNPQVCDALTQAGYDIVVLGEFGVDDGYPHGWRDNDDLRLALPNRKALHEPANLLELAGKLPLALGDKIPSLLLCGSRGGQVTAGQVWKHFWRGPTVCINAGCVTTNTAIPPGVFLTALPCTRDDLFGHNQPAAIDKLAERMRGQLMRGGAEAGVIVALNGESHMPMRLDEAIVAVCQLTVARCTDSQMWEDLLPTWCDARLVSVAGPRRGSKRRAPATTSAATQAARGFRPGCVLCAYTGRHAMQDV